MQEIVSFITACSHFTTVTRALIQARDDTQRTTLQIDFNTAILDLQGKLTALQISQQALVDENAALKKQLASQEKWEKESSRYELSQPTPGVFAYRLKVGHQDGEPGHLLCANCFQNNKKSILQRWNSAISKCPGCQTEFAIVSPRS